MSCENCEFETEVLDRVAYYRIGNGNVAVIGCQKHLAEMFARLNSRPPSKEAAKRWPMIQVCRLCNAQARHESRLEHTPGCAGDETIAPAPEKPSGEGALYGMLKRPAPKECGRCGGRGVVIIPAKDARIGPNTEPCPCTKEAA